MERLLRETKDEHFKIKAGVLGYDQGNVVMVDANQVWSVPEAIEYMMEFKPW